MTKPVYAVADVVPEGRKWTLWSEQRAPNERGSYRYRATFPFLGLTVTAEWTEEMRLCGMGYDEAEWWPSSSCHWNGYQRYITHNGLEWSPIREDDPCDIVWSGLDLLPCPFTGKPAKLEPQGQFIGAPLWRSEAVWISSPSVPKRRWTDAKAMQAAWNTRAVPTLEGEEADTAVTLDDLLAALEGILPLAEAEEQRRLIGDEGCLWPTENARDLVKRARAGGAA